MDLSRLDELEHPSFDYSWSPQKNEGALSPEAAHSAWCALFRRALLAATKVSCLSRAAALGAGAALGAADDVVTRGGRGATCVFDARS